MQQINKKPRKRKGIMMAVLSLFVLTGLYGALEYGKGNQVQHAKTTEKENRPLDLAATDDGEPEPIDVEREAGTEVEPVEQQGGKQPEQQVPTEQKPDKKPPAEPNKKPPEQPAGEKPQPSVPIKQPEVEKRPDPQGTKQTGQQVAYLTFDDGPTPFTPQILDLLKAADVKATFFLLAGQIERYPDVAKRILAEGHAVGLHGVTHVASKIYRSPQTVLQEMDTCNDVLQKITGVRTDLIRVPFGSYPHLTPPYREAIAHSGYQLWDWNVDSTDSSALSVPSDQIYRQVIEQVTHLKHSPVILFHDKKTTSEALPGILQQLQAKGYGMHKLSSDLPPVTFWN